MPGKGIANKSPRFLSASGNLVPDFLGRVFDALDLLLDLLAMTAQALDLFIQSKSGSGFGLFVCILELFDVRIPVVEPLLGSLDILISLAHSPHS
jgi:hypothetical protein